MISCLHHVMSCLHYMWQYCHYVNVKYRYGQCKYVGQANHLSIDILLVGPEVSRNGRSELGYVWKKIPPKVMCCFFHHLSLFCKKIKSNRIKKNKEKYREKIINKQKEKKRDTLITTPRTVDVWSILIRFITSNPNLN